MRYPRRRGCHRAVGGDLGHRVQTFQPGDAAGLLSAIGRARLMEADVANAAGFAAAHTWERALREELRELEALARW